MKLITVLSDQMVVSSDLARTSRSKQFEERLEASIAEIGLIEPIKAAAIPNDRYLIIDGVMRWRAITSIRARDPLAFSVIPVYVVDYDRRYEIRFQTDIYQDLLPSQLAALVEHLHQAEQVTKTDIARFIGVSPPTLRNYTGLWRLMQRGGLFASLVHMMDTEIIPASNPYAWLRLTAAGLRKVLQTHFTDGDPVETWIEMHVARARGGAVVSFSGTFVESVTSTLPADYYMSGAETRAQKRALGLRRQSQRQVPLPLQSPNPQKHLAKVERLSTEPVLKAAARALGRYLQ